jgi:hypothetical protein
MLAEIEVDLKSMYEGDSMKVRFSLLFLSFSLSAVPNKRSGPLTPSLSVLHRPQSCLRAMRRCVLSLLLFQA